MDMNITGWFNCYLWDLLLLTNVCCFTCDIMFGCQFQDGSDSVLQAANCSALLWEESFVREHCPSPCCRRVLGTQADYVSACIGVDIDYNCLPDASLVLIVTCSPFFRGSLAFFSLLSLDSDSKYSLSSFLDDPLPWYLMRTLSISLNNCNTKRNCSDNWATSILAPYGISHLELHSE